MQIALSASIYADKSTVVIEECNYIRAHAATVTSDNSTSKVEETTCIRAVKAELLLDKSKTTVTPSIYRAFSATLNTDISNISLITNKINAHFGSVYADESKVSITPSVCHPLEAVIYGDNSNSFITLSTLRALSAKVYSDKSKVKVEEFTRAVLGEPPYGETKVVVQGVDVALNGFNAIKNGTYAINVLVYWDRLSREGTKLKFTIKRTSNPDDEPYLVRDTTEGITIIHIEPYGNSAIKEYKAQIILRPADMIRLPNKATRVFYELLLEDSLNEDYLIERGNFMINPAI